MIRAPWVRLTSGPTIGLRELARTDIFLELFLPVVREYNKLVSGSLVSERLDEVVEEREYFWSFDNHQSMKNLRIV